MLISSFCWLVIVLISGRGGEGAFEAPDDKVLWIRGEASRIGRLVGGDFVPAIDAPQLTVSPAISGPMPAFSMNFSKNSISVYEFRNGSLVPGIKTPPAKFVPDVGSHIVSAAQHIEQGKTARLTYNRRESIADFWTAERRTQFPSGLPAVPLPTLTSPPAGWRLVRLAVAYPDAFGMGEPHYARVIHDVMEFGAIDGDGEFVPDYRLPVLPRTSVPTIVLGPLEKWSAAYTLPNDGAKNETVFEYRSGRLIKGLLSNNGVFTPKVASVILNFKDYNPEKEARIYNLPGVLKRGLP